MANDIEVAVEGALLDGMVCLASCDKTTPGQLMAAARINIPTIFVSCCYRVRVSGLTNGCPESTRDTVACDTPASFATSTLVGMERLRTRCSTKFMWAETFDHPMRQTARSAPSQRTAVA